MDPSPGSVSIALIMTQPSIALIGAEHEENLSLRYLAASAEQAGFATALHALNTPRDRTTAIAAILAADPLLVGISVPFQHRAAELLSVATDLRGAGYRGHITAGGHFATFEYTSILRDLPAVDSIVRHEGEHTLVALCQRIAGRRSVDGLPGLVTRGEGGARIGPKRPLPKLDALPFPDRRGAPHDVLGVLCSPILGSRGCYADCSFCCIYAYADNAQGPRYRMRSPEDIVREMEEEYRRRGVRLFVFHDDNFFLPYAPKNLERYRRMGELIANQGLTDIGLVIKCRPNDVSQELFALLKSMGMIRAYIGIETNSDEGVVSLNRRITSEDNRRALQLFRALDVYCSFNVLIFDPEATLDGVEANLDFMAEFADVPFNFCRAEVYAGTPLKATLEAEERLVGDYWAWGYELRRPEVEVLFRVATTAFYGRNFKPDGVANLNMGLRFDNEVLRHFYRAAWDPEWQAELTAFSRCVGEDTVERMRRAVAFIGAGHWQDRSAVKSFALDLAREVAAADLRLLKEAKRIRREMEARILSVASPERLRPAGPSAPPWAAETARLGTSVGLELSTEILPAPRAL